MNLSSRLIVSWPPCYVSHRDVATLYARLQSSKPRRVLFSYTWEVIFLTVVLVLIEFPGFALWCTSLYNMLLCLEWVCYIFHLVHPCVFYSGQSTFLSCTPFFFNLRSREFYLNPSFLQRKVTLGSSACQLLRQILATTADWDHVVRSQNLSASWFLRLKIFIAANLPKLKTPI